MPHRLQDPLLFGSKTPFSRATSFGNYVGEKHKFWAQWVVFQSNAYSTLDWECRQNTNFFFRQTQFWNLFGWHHKKSHCLPCSSGMCFFNLARINYGIANFHLCTLISFTLLEWILNFLVAWVYFYFTNLALDSLSPGMKHVSPPRDLQKS